MYQIITDSSALFTPEQGKAMGIEVLPLSVTIGDWQGRDLAMDMPRFYEYIRNGHLPQSSQPPVGEVIDAYEKHAGKKIINIAMADGLSGTYRSAEAAAALCDNAAGITVVNTRTLCGPHRYMVQKCVEMAKAGETLEKIRSWLNERMDSAKSYLMPEDFDYLRRGGRLSPLVSHVGKLANLVPVMTQTDDGCRLTIASIRRGYSAGVKYVAEQLQKKNIGKGWRVYIAHAALQEKVELTLKKLTEALPGATIEVVDLSPAFITQGGPGAVAIQYVME